MKHLLLIRHGRTIANEKKLYCGWTDVSLTEDGVSELKQLRDLRVYPDISNYKVYTSGLARTEETLKVLYGDVKHKVLPEFREMNFGEFEMKSYEDLKLEGVYKEWVSGDNINKRTPGGESGVEFRDRVSKRFKKLAFVPGDIMIVTHGGVISGLMAHFFKDEGKNMYEWQPKNGCGYLITFKGFLKPVSYTEIPIKKMD